MLKERYGERALRMSKAALGVGSLWATGRLFEPADDDEGFAWWCDDEWLLLRLAALLKRRPGAADGSSAQSLKWPSMPREASRFG
jgi:hypothetical protein